MADVVDDGAEGAGCKPAAHNRKEQRIIGAKKQLFLQVKMMKMRHNACPDRHHSPCWDLTLDAVLRQRYCGKPGLHAARVSHFPLCSIYARGACC